jgi:DNA-binding CsgD family transcriptional regulator
MLALDIDPRIDAEVARRCLLAAKSDLPVAVAAASFETAQVAEVYGYRQAAGGGPEALLSVSRGSGKSGHRVRLHSSRFWRSDPFLAYIARSEPRALSAALVDANDIALSDYRRQCFDLPAFREKLCFAWQSDASVVGLNFYVHEPLAEEAVERLAGIAWVVLVEIERDLVREAARSRPVLGRLEAGLGKEWPTLTGRERQVMARTLLGWPARRIAQSLAISEASVLTYRQRAYRRHDIGGAGGLLERLVD